MREGASTIEGGLPLPVALRATGKGYPIIRTGAERRMSENIEKPDS